jgi:hypothetical protein
MIPFGSTKNRTPPPLARGDQERWCIQRYFSAEQHGSSGHTGQGGQSQQVSSLGATISDTSRAIVRKIVQLLLASYKGAATRRRRAGGRHVGPSAWSVTGS